MSEFGPNSVSNGRAAGALEAARRQAWSIRPEPTEPELAALAVALTVALEAGDSASRRRDGPSASRWATVGRQQSVRGLAGGPTTGWGRALLDGRRG